MINAFCTESFILFSLSLGLGSVFFGLDWDGWVLFYKSYGSRRRHWRLWLKMINEMYQTPT